MQRERAENRMMIIWKKQSEISQRNNQRAQNISNLKIFYNLVLRFSLIFIGQIFSKNFVLNRSNIFVWVPIIFMHIIFKFHFRFKLKKKWKVSVGLHSLKRKRKKKEMIDIHIYLCFSCIWQHCFCLTILDICDVNILSHINFLWTHIMTWSLLKYTYTFKSALSFPNPLVTFYKNLPIF